MRSEQVYITLCGYCTPITVDAELVGERQLIKLATAPVSKDPARGPSRRMLNGSARWRVHSQAVFLSLV